MLLHQYYLDCLSHASYLIADEASGRAAVVDPQRDVAGYLADAAAAGLTITHVVETHVHADFVSGHLELAARTGAEICFGAGAELGFPFRPLADGDTIDLGEVRLEVLATPGHTPESICLVVWAGPGDDAPHAVLTGDTLFVGDVGRPDLLSGAGHTPEAMARALYRSLHTKLLTLPDTTRVLPAHGAGSACGRSMSTELQSTIGEQRRTNHALAPMEEDAFVALVTDGQPTTPAYFAFDAHTNRQAHALLDEETPPPVLTPDEVRAAQEAGAVVLDVRSPEEFGRGHLAGSINVGLEGRFAEYAGDVLLPGDRIVVVGEPQTALAAKVRLGRIGFDQVIGSADAAAVLVQLPEVACRSSRLTAAELDSRRHQVPGLVVIDVRNPGEVAASGAIPGALGVPLPRLREAMGDLDPRAPTVVYCAGGYRSSIAASTLAAHGFGDVSDLVGGYAAWAAWSAAQAGSSR